MNWPDLKKNSTQKPPVKLSNSFAPTSSAPFVLECSNSPTNNTEGIDLPTGPLWVQDTKHIKTNTRLILGVKNNIVNN